MAAVEGDFRAQPAAETEAAGRIEQAVAAVIAEAERHRRDREFPGVFDPGTAEHTAFAGRQQLAAVGPGPFLLPDEVALPLDVAGEVDRLGGVGGELLMRRCQLKIECLVALEEVGAAQLDA